MMIKHWKNIKQNMQVALLHYSDIKVWVKWTLNSYGKLH